MKKTLRLLLFEDCERNCEGCCNKQWDLANLPVFKFDRIFDEFVLTGGEPMLKPELVEDTIWKIRSNFRLPRIYVYTAKLIDIVWAFRILWASDGMTVTLHEQQDLIPFSYFNVLVNRYKLYDTKSLRLNVFKGIDLSGASTVGWKKKDNMEWMDNCPLPSHETFMRL